VTTHCDEMVVLRSAVAIGARDLSYVIACKALRRATIASLALQHSLSIEMALLHDSVEHYNYK
jgi:hypothetical protein